MRSIIMLLFMVLFSSSRVSAQTDSTLKTFRDTTFIKDSATIAKPLSDTIPALVRMPDSLRHNQFVDTLLKQYAFDPFLFNGHSLKQKQLRMGHERPSRETWVIVVIVFLLIYAGVVNRLMSMDVYNVIRAFYMKQSFTKLSREDNLLTSWAFIFLFALFGLTLGLYIYQIIIYYNVTYSIAGAQLFLTCSVIVIALCVLKILTLRIIGYIFDISRIVGEYVSILYLSYFNLAFIFLPIVICFSLFPATLMPYLLDVSIGLIIIVVLIQYVRSILNIISNFTFHKIYLFIYLCALEICPVLILIKALNL